MTIFNYAYSALTVDPSQAGNSPLSADELQHAVETRGKKKPLVTITVYKTHIQIQYKNQVSTIAEL